MPVYGLYMALLKWKRKPCLETFIGIYKTGFDKGCKWSVPRKLLRVAVNLLNGRYERFYKYYSKDYGGGV